MHNFKIRSNHKGQKIVAPINTPSFEVNPLDVNLVKMQFNLTKRIEREIPQDGDFAPVFETFESKSPILDLSDVKISCKHKKDIGSSTRIVELLSKNRAKTKEQAFILFEGTKKELIDYINQTTFFEDCKKTIKSFLNS